MVTVEILYFRENSHGRTGNRTRDLMISSQRLRPIDHEAGRNWNVMDYKINLYYIVEFMQLVPAKWTSQTDQNIISKIVVYYGSKG